MDKIWEVWWIDQLYGRNELMERFRTEDKAYEWINVSDRPIEYVVKGPFHVL